MVQVDDASAKADDVEDRLRASLAALGFPAPSRSMLLKYDFNPIGEEPRHAEIQKGRLFVGGSYVAFVSFA